MLTIPIAVTQCINTYIAVLLCIIAICVHTLCMVMQSLYDKATTPFSLCMGCSYSYIAYSTIFQASHTAMEAEQGGRRGDRPLPPKIVQNVHAIS